MSISERNSLYTYCNGTLTPKNISIPVVSDLYPMSHIHLAPNPTRAENMPDVAWNPWTDVRERDDIKALNISFPFGHMPSSFQVKSSTTHR